MEGNDPSGRGIRLEPMLFEILLPHHALHSILWRKPVPLSGSSTGGAEASCSNRRPASWQLVQ